MTIYDIDQIKNFLVSKRISSDNDFKNLEIMPIYSANNLKKYIECFGNENENFDTVIKYYNDFSEKAKDSKLTKREQIYWLMIHGVEVNNKGFAMEFLTQRNYFYKIIQYVKDFPNEVVDFDQLVDLSTIDMELRYVLLKASLDVEHAIKTFLSRIITNSTTHDGYQIVSDVFKEDDDFKEKVFRPFGRYENGCFKINDGYAEIYKHPSFWFVIENTTLGKVTPFVNYLSQKSPMNKDLTLIKASIYSVSKLRNKAAHSNGILNTDIIKRKRNINIDSNIYNGLIMDGFNKNIFRTPLLAQIAILIFLHKKLTSKKMHEHRILEIEEVINRSKRKKYKNSPTIDGFISDLNLLLTNYYGVI